MAEYIIDILEAVQVQDQYKAMFPCFVCLCDGGTDQLDELRAVRQVGEGIPVS